MCAHLKLSLLLTSLLVKSVVALHGIWGHGKKCWETNSDPSSGWLNDTFGEDKHPRVILVEYETTQWTLQDIYQIARNLLSRLLELRDPIKVSLHHNATCRQTRDS